MTSVEERVAAIERRLSGARGTKRLTYRPTDEDLAVLARELTDGLAAELDRRGLAITERPS